ncbi:MAG TPA: carboxypeptidase-like regulatory domain-containing protein [Armatimonadota bacterium]|nr:carboxypeptidase-like regulatory domain-containing protein [Armatimonadota bacterium]
MDQKPTLRTAAGAAALLAAGLAGGALIGQQAAQSPQAPAPPAPQVLTAPAGPEGGPPQLVDAATGAPLPGVKLTISYLPGTAADPPQRRVFYETFSCTYGHFLFDGMSAGTWRVIPSRPGYYFLPPSADVTVGQNATPLQEVHFTGYQLTAPTAPQRLARAER